MKSELIAEILDRGKDDWLDFAEVMSIVRTHSRIDEPAAIALSVELICEMLEQRSISVGDLLKRGETVAFAPWDGPPRLIVERIHANLINLGHRPGIGEICWLSTV
jgi:hypothetical protein